MTNDVPDPADVLENVAQGFGRELAAGLLGTAHQLEESHEESSGDSAEKSIEEVYRDRNLLAFALCRAVADAYGNSRVGAYVHGEWAVVAVDLPEDGLASWHVRPETVPDWIPERSAEEWFDGHTREVKNQRVERYAFVPQEVRDK